MRKFVTAIIIILSIVAGVMFIKAMFELEEEASDYLESRQDSAADQSSDKTTDLEIATDNDKSNSDQFISNKDTSDVKTSEARESIKNLLNDPTLPESLTREPKLIISELYEDLFIVLGLTDEEIEKFADITLVSSAPGSENKQNAELDDDIKELIGEFYYDDYSQYNKTLEQRIMLIKYKYKLVSSDIPLMQNQQEKLLDLMLEDCELECDKYILGKSADFLDSEQIEVLEKLLADTQEN